MCKTLKKKLNQEDNGAWIKQEWNKLKDLSRTDRIPGFIRDRQNTWIYQKQTEYLDLSEIDRIPGFIRDRQNTWIYQRQTE